MLGKVVTSVDVTFTFQMTEEEFTATLTPVTSTLRASKFTFQATTYPEGQYIVKFVETGQTEVLATVAGFVSGNPIFATSQYNTYNDDGTSTTYVPSDDQGLVPSVSQKLRVSTIDQATDVSYVRYLKVTNGTLTDNGDNSVTLDTGGGGAEALNDLTDVTITGFPASDILWFNAVTSQWVNVDLNLPLLSDTKGTPSEGQYLKYTGGFWQPATISLPSPPPSDTDGLPEGTTNLYYTEARVSANSDVTANTAKNSYPTADATKLAGIAAGAEVNVIDAVVDDTTPQLGGNLDVNGNEIQSAGDVIVRVDSDNNTALSKFVIKDGAGTSIYTIDEEGTTIATTGASNNIKIGNLDGSLGTFNGISLNDNLTYPGIVGFAGGSSSNDFFYLFGEDIDIRAGGASDPSIRISEDATLGSLVVINSAFPTPTTHNFYVSGTGKFTGNVDVDSGLDVTGNITVTGTVDGIDIATDVAANTAKVGYTDAAVDLRIAAASIGDLSDVPASLGTSGQVLAVNSGGTALEYVAQSGGGGSTVSLKGKFIIWAEENGVLSTSQGSGYQWSFGNGDEADVGLALPFDCTATQMIFNCVTRGTSGTVNLHKGTSTTSTTSTSVESISFGSVYSATNTFSTPVSFSAGEWMTFKTSAVSGTFNDCRVGVVFEYDIADLTAYQGTQGPSGTSYDVTTITTSTTLSSSHTTKYIVCNSASAMNLTVPASATYDTYAEFVIEQRGAGQVTVVADTGVTIHSTETLKSGAQYAVMGLKRTATNTYVLTGERAAS